MLWVPAGLLLTAGAELIDLDHAYAYAFFNLAWAGGFTVGAAGGGALAQVSTDAVPISCSRRPTPSRWRWPARGASAGGGRA